ncbi:transcription termination/antitermination protein NusG [Mycoplasmopsis synoviae]|uniref:Transcription termination/antitermination protein NusG n=2 Tax=Mycoplasmopsis synoviae TaxID=2109 RepID=Q4A648_MYCS5|nr:transcription termination/antitermination protein NusG [Mycoplasmopsis synoviae]AAZ43773.1 transcription antitermination protein [Mycoplasmopsis synoviae 53]AKB11099.1 antitermination protein NusG [Mycoplasmopsis synoviae ATCC 25204]AKJ20583.1 Transcription antitermination protein NusG [Mycoplasmopsis synoviae]AQU47903.1 Transcription antitermination protein NusG [Mycoplasmopsis synoviae]AWL84150.1 transcription termination/antitermination protein NusG [Mycoplasmopsis synoviae]
MQNSKFRWYLISTITGKEAVIVEALKNRIKSENIEQFFDFSATEDGPFKVFKVPSITKTELNKKQKGLAYKVKWKNMFPGYIFVKADMQDLVWYIIRNTLQVTGIIGSGGGGEKPTPVSQNQIRKSLEKEEEAKKLFEENKNLLNLKVGDLVLITDGNWVGNEAVIEKIIVEDNMAEISFEDFNKKVEFKINLDWLTRIERN